MQFSIKLGKTNLRISIKVDNTNMRGNMQDPTTGLCVTATVDPPQKAPGLTSLSRFSSLSLSQRRLVSTLRLHPHPRLHPQCVCVCVFNPGGGGGHAFAREK